MKTLALFLTGLAVAAAGAPAYAAEPATRTVAHRDLDLATSAGKRALDARVRRAAGALCLDPREQSLSMRMARKACFDRAVSSAEPLVASAVARDLAVRATRSAAVE